MHVRFNANLIATIAGFAAAVFAPSLPQATARAAEFETVATGSHVKVDVDLDAVTAFEASAAGKTAMLVTDAISFRVYSINASLAGQANVIDGVTVRDDYDRILLRRGELDTRAGSRTPGRKAERSLGLVQFAGPVTDKQLEQLAATGARLVHYVPQNAYIVWSPDVATRQALTDATGAGKLLQFFDDYTAEESLSPALDSHQGDTDVEVTVQIYNATDAQVMAGASAIDEVMAFATDVRTLPHRVLDGLYTNMTITVPGPALQAIASLEAVVNVEPWIEPTRNSERQAQSMAGNLNAAGTGPSGAGYLAWLTSKGFPSTASSYPLLTVVDDGVDNGSTSPLDQALKTGGASAGASRLIANQNVTTDASGAGLQGHGHLNTTIAMGYDTGLGLLDGVYLRAMGINPFGRVGAVKIFTNAGAYNTSGAGGTDAGLIAAEWNQGATLSTNSWGAAVSGAYNATAQAYDAGTRDASTSVAGNQELFFIFSAGNSGAGATTIGSPGTAKNVLTVGASEDTDANGTDGCATTATEADNIQQIVGFSSRGPCADGRAKPEIVAPGTHVSGRANPVSGYTGTGVCDQYWPSGQTIYARSSGTSHSTPAVGGMATLLGNYLSRVHGMSSPSPALMKASIINSARYLAATGGNLPGTAQGYGFTDMGQAFDSTIQRVLVNQSVVLGATGDTQTLAGSIADATKPVRVTLAWTDPAGVTTGSAWVNDLNLTVTVNGTVYKGNVFSGANSVTGGTADSKNNYECVFLPAGTTGSISVTVTAANIAGNGVPGNADATDQDYALVVSNMTQTGVALSGTGANAIADTVGNGNSNGRIDPGETSIRVTVPVQNNGPSTATGVSATLVSNTPTVSVSSATSSYSNLTGSGGAASNATPFVLSVSPSHPCGSSISLTLNITSAQGSGTYNFTLPTGLAGSAVTQTASYTGPAVAIPDNNAAGASTSLVVSGVSNPISGLKFRFDGSSCNATAGSTTVGLDHTYVGDLTITLQSPAGTIVTLMSRPGGTNNGGNNFCGTILDDAGASGIQAITAAGNPWTGTYTPNSALSAFNGQSANGTWILKVVDSAATDTGNIRAWSLVITSTGATTCDPPSSSCTAPVVTTQPASTSGCVGGSASFTVVASGTSPTFQWRKGGVNIAGATAGTLTLSGLTAGSAGSYDCVITNACGTVTSNAASLTMNTAAGVATSPSSVTTCSGAAAAFSVVVSGLPVPSVQWRKGGANIAGATGLTYSIPSVTATDAGSYDCVVTNTCGSATSAAATLTVNAAPTISSQPGAVATCVGTSASFSVAASGTPAPTFQWRKNASNIAGATSATYSIASVAASDVAGYDCVITNSCGSVTSASASLTLSNGPSVTSDPTSLSVCAGQPASFSITATGATSYQWKLNGSAIAGATSATYSITAASATDAGSYLCVATNSCGSVSSATATLSLGTPPVNDDASGALPLVMGVAQSGNTCAATIDAVGVCSGQTLSAGGVWYSIGGTGTTLTVALCGSSFDTRLSAYCGAPGSLTCVAGNDDSCGLSSSVTFCTESGGSYYLLVHGFGTATGAFTIIATDSGAACTPTVTCLVTGACCTGNGCQILTRADCDAAGGTYSGDGTSCTIDTYSAAFTSGDAFPLAIPDYVGTTPGQVSSTIRVSGSGGVASSLAVSVGLTHTYVGDLIATLSKDGTSVTLFNRPGASNDLGGTYVFDDAAATTFVAGAAASSPVASDTYSPASPLAAFDGVALDGTWTLTVTDNANVDVGTIDGFSIGVIDHASTCSSCPPCAADFNQDGGVDGNDIGAFFSVWETGGGCADVNQDGGVDGSDIDAFFELWQNGGC